MPKSSVTSSAPNVTETKKLTPKQIRGLDLIMSGMPLQEVASQLGVSRQTISEWKNQHPAFKAKLDELKAEAERELSYAIPMNDAFMMGQLRQLASEGPPDHRLRAIQYYYDRFSQVAVDPVGRAQSPDDDLLLRAIGLHRETTSPIRQVAP